MNITVALTGNPNAGKTSLFNLLSGSRERVANYPGITVEKKIGHAQWKDNSFSFYDLPGTYSLSAVSAEEMVTSDFLTGRTGLTADVILFVADSLALARNLYLLTQVAESGKPVIAVLSKTLEARANGKQIDLQKLSRLSGISFIDSAGNPLEVREQIFTAIVNVARQKYKQTVPDFYSKEDAIAIATAQEILQAAGTAMHPAEIFMLLSGEPKTKKEILELWHNHVGLLYPGKWRRQRRSQNKWHNQLDPLNPGKWRRQRRNQNKWHNQLDLLNPSKWHRQRRNQNKWHNQLDPLYPEKRKEVLSALEKIAGQKASQNGYAESVRRRYAWIDSIVEQSVTLDKPDKKTLTSKMDKILMSRIFGPVIFLGIFTVLFEAIYTWSAPLMGLIESGIALLQQGASALLSRLPMFHDLVVDGIIGGAGSVLVFLPQIVILFAFIAVLEESGYLSRASYLTDKFVSWSGLSGKSFIPMLSGFACSIPGIMAARTIPNRTARIATILTVPLVSCASRLPVYMLFISAFIQPVYGNAAAAFTFLLMNSLGALLTLPVAWIIGKKFLQPSPTPFLLEMPDYRIPNLRSVYDRMTEAGRDFLKQAGTIIFIFSIIIWSLSYFPRAQNATAAAQLEQSYLGRAGKFVQPVFAPMDFDWKTTIGIVAAFPARELLVSTLGILYESEATADEFSSLSEKLAAEKSHSPASAMALIVFFALSAQCVATLVTVRQETASLRYALALFFYMTALAWLLSWLTYVTLNAVGLG